MNEIQRHSNYKVELLKNQSITAYLSDKERAVALTVNGELINQIPEDQLAHKCGVLAKGICSDFGIRSVEPDQVFQFMQILKNYYGTYTLKEIKKAFELLAVGELDHYLPTNSKGDPDGNHYQQFNISWVGKILKAYTGYRSKIWSKIQDLNSKIIPEVSEHFKKEQMRLFRNALKSYVKEYEETGRIEVVYPVYVANWMVKNEVLEPREIEEKHLKRAFHSIMAGDKKNAKEKNEVKMLWEAGGISSDLRTEAERLLSIEMVEEGFKRVLSGEKEL